MEIRQLDFKLGKNAHIPGLGATMTAAQLRIRAKPYGSVLRRQTALIWHTPPQQGQVIRVQIHGRCLTSFQLSDNTVYQ